MNVVADRAALRTRGIDTELRTIGEAASCVGVPVYLVGGAVRDALLQVDSLDVDVAVEASFGAASRFVDALINHGLRLTARHDRFGTATLASASGRRVDVAATRRETYPRHGSLPVVSEGATVLEDLPRRDFTIHAMASSLGRNGALGAVLDPFGGREDVSRRTLRLLHPASLVDDPTRAFRGVRYGARLGFALEEAIGERLEAARAAGSFRSLTGDRLRRALGEVLEEANVKEGVLRLVAFGLLGDVHAAWSAHPPDPREVSAAASVEERWTALLRPLPPASRREVAERLRFSRKLRRAAEVPA